MGGQKLFASFGTSRPCHSTWWRLRESPLLLSLGVLALLSPSPCARISLPIAQQETRNHTLLPSLPHSLTLRKQLLDVHGIDGRAPSEHDERLVALRLPAMESARLRNSRSDHEQIACVLKCA